MFHYIVVDRITGEIKYPAYGTSESCFIRDDCIVIKIDKPLNNHEDYFFNIRTGQVEKRIECPVVVSKNTIKADSTEEAIISNIPRGCACLHDGKEYTIDDGIIEFTADHVGDYVFLFSLFPYNPVTITVEATKP